MKNGLLLALSVLITLSACTNSNGNGVLGKTKARENIYDGEITSEDNLISKTTVLIHNGSGVCTGSLLSPTIVLTAAHCAVSRDNTLIPASSFNILEDSKANTFSEWMKNPVRLAEVEKSVVHPIFMGLLSSSGPYAPGYDLALLKLKTPLSDKFKAVVLSDSMEALTENQIRMAGFGTHSNDVDLETALDGRLRNGNFELDISKTKIEMPINTEPQPKAVPYLITNTPSSTLLSFKKGPADSSLCHGDSGGPIYFEKDGQIHLVGVNEGILFGGEENCSQPNSTQIVVSMAGPSLRFVLDTYKELTGQSLPNKKFPAEEDPNTFEYYLKSAELKPATEDISLQGLSVIQDPQTKTSAFINSEQLPLACLGLTSLITTPNLVMLDWKQPLDGKLALPLMAIKDGIYQMIVEGRVEIRGDKVKTVVRTSKGYLSAEMPLADCRNIKPPQ